MLFLRKCSGNIPPMACPQGTCDSNEIKHMVVRDVLLFDVPCHVLRSCRDAEEGVKMFHSSAVCVELHVVAVVSKSLSYFWCYCCTCSCAWYVCTSATMRMFFE